MNSKDTGPQPADDVDLDVVMAVEPLLQAAVALHVAVAAAERERHALPRMTTPDELHRHWGATQVAVRHASDTLRAQVDAFVAKSLAAANELRECKASRRLN
jgi:hypothetical protein